MHHVKAPLVRILVLLFLVLGFNAYACLLPFPIVPVAAMQGGCSDPQDQPVRQFCDAFKTLALQPPPGIQPVIESQAFCPEDTASLTLLVRIQAHNLLEYDHSTDRPPQDLLLKTSVLRV